MFKFKKNFFTTLLITAGVFNSFAWAAVPNAPGAYVGATLIDCDTCSVRIDFLDNSDNEDSFEIIGDINMSLPANDETDNAYVYADISDLVCDKVYQIKVIAKNADGSSTASDTRAFNMKTTFGCEDNCTVPNAPGPYLGVTDINKTAVRVNFVDNSDNETGFRITGNDINETVSPQSGVGSQVYHDIYGLTCDTLYHIEAVAFNDCGDSDPSDLRYFRIETTFGVDCDENNGTMMLPNAPGPYLGVTDINQTAVRVNFSDNSDNETGFRIYSINGTGINKTISANDETENSTVYTNLTGLTCDTLYQIEAVAFNDKGDSDPSDSRYFRISSSFGVSCD